MSGKSEMTAWKSIFFVIYSPLMYSVRREEGANAIFFRQNIFSRQKLNERKSPKADVPESEARPLCQQNLGESVQMYLVLKKSRLVFMETSVVLFRRSFLFRSTNRNWSAQRGISPEKCPPTNLFPLEICLYRSR